VKNEEVLGKGTGDNREIGGGEERSSSLMTLMPDKIGIASHSFCINPTPKQGIVADSLAYAAG
jgi:hypothetical protein